MTFLRGKSVTYGRYKANVSPTELAQAVPQFSPIGPGDEYTESFGTCSWRSLLDGPVDAGFLNGGDFNVTGLRYDKKKAPSQLVQAITARELYDAAVLGQLSKKRMAEIKSEVRTRLDTEAMPKPGHGMIAADTPKCVFYLDGPAGSSAILCDLVGLTPLYSEMPEYRKFLAWMAWRGAMAENRNSELVFPMGVASFKNMQSEKTATFSGENAAKLLAEYLPSGWEMTRCSYAWQVSGEVCYVTLEASTMKTALTFPEEVLNLDPPEGCENVTEWRLASRLGFVALFEESLAREVTVFLSRESGNTLESEFEALFPGDPGDDALDQASGGL